MYFIEFVSEPTALGGFELNIICHSMKALHTIKPKVEVLSANFFLSSNVTESVGVSAFSWVSQAES